MTEEKPQVQAAEDAVRELKNWIFTFAKEYSLADEAIKKLDEKADEIAKKVADIKCEATAEGIKAAEDEVRNIKNWVSTFAEEYSLAEEAVNMLNTKVEDLAAKIGAITC